MIRLRGKKALIVDDVQVIRTIIEKKLAEEGVSSDAAVGGAEAIEMIQRNDYDFVLMDLVMPNMDGFITTIKIRMLGYLSLPIIAITSLEDPEILKKIDDCGMNGHLMKPIKIHKLCALLEQLENDDGPKRPWLKLMYITNREDVALVAEKYGVDRIWIDLETIGKEQRQPGNTVKSHHSIDDIRRIKPLLTRAEMLVRINPWNDGSPAEIEDVINAGADMIMLPFWKTEEEVALFMKSVGKRCKTTLLVETKEAVACLDNVLRLHPDEVHIGLNDLHLSYGKDFMFELLSDGTVDAICEKLRRANIPYGFGGIARLGKGLIKSENIILEHRRLGSTRAILSRSFCDANICKDIKEIELIFEDSMKELFAFEQVCLNAGSDIIAENRTIVTKAIDEVAERMRAKKNEE